MRYVTHSRKNTDGDILAIGTPGQSWSPRLKADAIRDIESGVESYYTINAARQTAKVNVVVMNGGKHLKSAADAVWSNNLDNLPDF